MICMGHSLLLAEEASNGSANDDDENTTAQEKLKKINGDKKLSNDEKRQKRQQYLSDVFDDTPKADTTPEVSKQKAPNLPYSNPDSSAYTDKGEYKSFQNQSLGKQEMLQVVDKKLANYEKKLTEILETIKKLEQSIGPMATQINSIENFEIPKLKKQLAGGLHFGEDSSRAMAVPSGQSELGTGSGTATSLGKVLEGLGDGELASMKKKIIELEGTTIPKLQFEISDLKDMIRNLEVQMATMEVSKLKARPSITIEQDKKAP